MEPHDTSSAMKTQIEITPHQLQQERHVLRLGLIAVFWITVGASLWEWNGQSLELLRAGGVASTGLAHGLIAAGVLLDALLALALMFWPCRMIYVCTALAVLGLTGVATVMLPELWLHPIGPLSKNLPILAVLWVLWRRA